MSQAQSVVNEATRLIQTYSGSYLAVLIFFLVMSAIGFGILLVAFFLRPHRPNAQKGSVYECGIEPVGDARSRQIVRFFIVAMLFVVFDIETIFIFPWAVTFGIIGVFGLIEMVLFIVIVLIGYLYIVRKDGLKWV